MSMQGLERAILVEAKKVTGNKKLKMKDIMEWSTEEVKKFPDEKQYLLPKLSINISVKGESK